MSLWGGRRLSGDLVYDWDTTECIQLGSNTMVVPGEGLAQKEGLIIDDSKGKLASTIVK